MRPPTDPGSDNPWDVYAAGYPPYGGPSIPSTPHAGYPPHAVYPGVPEPPVPEWCAFHPGIPAWVRCSRCGRPTCADCTHVVDVGQRCPECYRRAAAGRRLRAALPRPAILTQVLIGICVGIYFLDTLSGNRLARLGMSQPYFVFVRGDWWRLLTAIFLHAGLLHLLFNMYALYISGTLLEEAWGRLKLIAAFVATGVFASIFSAVVRLSAGSPAQALRSPGSVGASGAIFGLFGALAVVLYRRRYSPWARSSLSQLLAILMINLVLGFTVAGIDAWAHLGGLISGLVIGLGFDPSSNDERRLAPTLASLAIVIASSVVLIEWGLRLTAFARA